MAKSRIFTEPPSTWMERVWQENAPQIYKLCRSRSSDAEAAKDLFQEVALRFCKSADGFDRSKPLFPWIMTVIRNARCDQYRRRHAYVPLRFLPEYTGGYDVGKQEHEICEERRARFIRRQLDDFMESLTVSEKLAVEYTCIGGFNSREASIYCGIDRNTLFKRKNSAMKKMRERKDCYLSMLKNSGSSTLDLEDLLTHADEFS